MYDEEKEKKKVLALLKESSSQEIKYTKNENFLRAIEFAKEEVDELDREFQRFVERVDHLVVFQEMVKEPLTKDMNKTTQNLKYLIEKNYTKEDKESMPTEVLRQVKATQDKRIDLLKRIAIRYFHRPNK